MKGQDNRKKIAESNVGKFRDRLKSGWFTVFAVLVLLAIVWPLSKNLSQEKSLERDIKLAQAEIDKYEGENQKLQELIGYLGSDQAVEDKARMNLGMKKAGEKVVVIQEKKPETTVDDQGVDTATGNNFQRWYHYFFK